MNQTHNRVVELMRFGEPEGLQVIDAPLPKPRRGEVRIRVLASGLEYTDVVIRRHQYVQTMRRRPPFVMGYDVIGEIDELGEGVTGFRIGDRVADMTVLGSNAEYRTLKAKNLTRVPKEIDVAEAATLVLSWTTAYQLLHRAARVKAGQRVLVQGAAGAVGQALVVLGRIAGLEIWGTARASHAPLLRELGATPIDYEHEDFTRVVPEGFDVVFDGIAQGGYGGSLKALKRGGLVCAYGYTAGVGAKVRPLGTVVWFLRQYVQYLTTWRTRGRRLRIYSINMMRARHPAWFKEDLARLFELLAKGEIHPRVADEISFDEIVDAHRRIERGGLEGKLVLRPDLHAW